MVVLTCPIIVFLKMIRARVLAKMHKESHHYLFILQQEMFEKSIWLFACNHVTKVDENPQLFLKSYVNNRKI